MTFAPYGLAFLAAAGILLAGCLEPEDETSPSPTTSPTPVAVIRFLDDADTAQAWTMSKAVFAQDPAQGDRVVPGQQHPLAAGWHVTTKAAFSGAKSWTMQDEARGGYHDNEYTSMTSAPIDLSGAKSATFSFWHKGDAEANNIDGLYWQTSGDGTTWSTQGSISGLVDAWKQETVDISELTGGKVQLRLLFKSDAGCSVDTPTPAGCGEGQYIGYFVDDIVVTIL